jgi:hypothetical protein
MSDTEIKKKFLHQALLYNCKLIMNKTQENDERFDNMTYNSNSEKNCKKQCRLDAERVRSK